MILSQQIAAALDENTCALTPPCSFTTEHGDDTMTLELTSLDRVGLAFSQLEFKSRKHDDWSTEAIKAWGNRLASRVTYLMEPLVIVEVDADEREVQLRSQSPTSRAEKRSYYEVCINHQGILNLARYSFDEATRRRSRTNCQLTREVVERLADDIVASIP